MVADKCPIGPIGLNRLSPNGLIGPIRPFLPPPPPGTCQRMFKLSHCLPFCQLQRSLARHICHILYKYASLFVVFGVWYAICS